MLMIALSILQYTIPYDSPVTQQMEYLQTQGLMDIPMIRPYKLHWLLPQIDSLILSDRDLSKTEQQALSLLVPIITKSENFSYLIHLGGFYRYEPEFYGGFLDYRAGGKLVDNIHFSHGMRFQRTSETDSFGPQPWRGFQVYMTEGLVHFNLRPVRLQLGRSNHLFGYGDGSSLFLSQDRQGYDGFALFIPSRFLEFYNIFSVLDASTNRYLTIHRLGLRLGKIVSLGFSEALLFCNSLEPLYVNFLLPYYLTQWGTYRDDNVLWCFDTRIRAFGATIYGELLIDDYMFEDDPYPDKIGWKIGLTGCLFDLFLTTFSYTFVDKWVYTQRLSINTYEQNGYPIGFPLGNDVDRLLFSTSYVNALHVHPCIRLAYTRKGEGSIDLPYEVEGGDWNPPFPSGIVEKTIDVRFGIEYTIGNRLYVCGDIGKIFQENTAHITGNDQNEVVFSASLWIVY